jgi:hypothetical protein
MKKHTLFLKDGLKRALQTTCGLSLLLAASIFSGCATAVPLGALTVAGIPTEFEGESAQATLSGASGVSVYSEGASVTNGEAKLPLYTIYMQGFKNGYAGNETVKVRFQVADALVFFSPVKVENGEATVNWDDGNRAKPRKLSYSVTAEQAGAKVDEIIAYSGTPSHTEESARQLKSTWSYFASYWSMNNGYGAIRQINALIDSIPEAD